MEKKRGRQKHRYLDRENWGVEGLERGREMRETLWERQREEEGEGCCILVIAQTEAAGADRGMERINEKGRNSETGEQQCTAGFPHR